MLYFYHWPNLESTGAKVRTVMINVSLSWVTFVTCQAIPCHGERWEVLLASSQSGIVKTKPARLLSPPLIAIMSVIISSNTQFLFHGNISALNGWKKNRLKVKDLKNKTDNSLLPHCLVPTLIITRQDYKWLMNRDLSTWRETINIELTSWRVSHAKVLDLESDRDTHLSIS